MTLPAFASQRRAAALRRCGWALAAVDRSSARTALSSKPAARCGGMMGQTIKQTDGRTLDRFIDSAPHGLL